MSTELTSQATFENNIKDRIRKDIGDLLPDEVLKGIVEKAVWAILNEKGKDGYGNNERLTRIEKHVKEVCDDKISTITKEVLADTDGKLKESIVDFLTKNSTNIFAELFIKTISYQGQANIMNYHQELCRNLQNKGIGIY